MCRSQSLEVGEGLVDELRALLPDPQLHRRLRESELELLALVAQPPLGLQLPTIGPGSDRSIPVLPASTNRSRQLSTVAEDTPCRRAALASDNSPFNTANTTWICSSTDTCRDGFCCLLTQPSFPTPQPLPESLTHSTPSPWKATARVNAVPSPAGQWRQHRQPPGTTSS
jgi:hypothetical protein